uniref:Uncharacterized protein n=1 Tax=Spongospora subterranea TaxID=70186 RepID=A0A0H5QLE4_9EUKA|eukprot:CRZ02427.1 hypothetical protein [Spongospora subterranea]
MSHDVNEPDPGDDYTFDIGDSSRTDGRQAIDAMVNRSVSERLDLQFKQRLQEIVFRHENVWRTKDGRRSTGKSHRYELNSNPTALIIVLMLAATLHSIFVSS